MLDLLKQFWLWTGTTPEQYDSKGAHQSYGVDECNFPLFSELITYAKHIVDDGLISINEIDDLMTIMALDNESESVLEYAIENATDLQISSMCEIGINHQLYHARWQLAELICIKKPKNYTHYLSVLSNDKHPYVRNRAINCIERLTQ
ncbi:MAG: hypothetical protein IJY23_04520 [Clostridia bacterium]|nr:hypothetical protein [Clostridia bacterium]